jgi:hypothetical protein
VVYYEIYIWYFDLANHEWKNQNLYIYFLQLFHQCFQLAFNLLLFSCRFIYENMLLGFVTILNSDLLSLLLNNHCFYLHKFLCKFSLLMFFGLIVHLPWSSSWETFFRLGFLLCGCFNWNVEFVISTYYFNVEFATCQLNKEDCTNIALIWVAWCAHDWT